MLLAFSALASAAQPDNEILVENGRFYVGNVFGQHDYAAHTNVQLNAFVIMRAEVTYRQYSDVHEWAVTRGYVFGEGCNGATYEDCLAPDKDNGEHPVTNVEWSDAIVFANALSEKTGLKPVYLDSKGNPVRDSTQYEHVVDSQANGYRLPTAEEWQVAARGGKPGLKNGSYGYKFSGSLHAEAVAWFPDFNTPLFGTTRVKSLQPNALGLYDMSGNVSEWVYAMDSISGIRMYYFCGGSFLLPTTSLASCDTHSAGYSMPDTGFRLVHNANE